MKMKKIVSSTLAVAMCGSMFLNTGITAKAAEDDSLVFPSNYSLDLVQPISDNEKVDALVEGLLDSMTEDEMYSFLGGSGTGTDGNAGSLPGVGRLGVPSIKMYDGPAGILYPDDTTNMPQEEMLAATWSEEMADLYGQTEGSENVATGGCMALSAQLDIQRVPQFGRTKDQMGEDSYLLSSLADDLVSGMQEDGGIAVLKHYAGFTNNDSPAAVSDDEISEQALHENYLVGFESAVKNGNALGVMSSYNAVNGEKASSNTYLLQDVLREMWNYAYFTITDWGGNNGYTLNKGTDIEMPTLSNNSKSKTEEQVAAGNMTEEEASETVREACARVLRAYGAGGYLTLVQLDENGKAIEGTVEDGDDTIDPCTKTESLEKLEELYDENNDNVETIAEEGGVLLKNDECSDGETALPLNTDDDNTVAVVGFTGMNLASGIGGERSYGAVSAMESPYEALTDLLGTDKVSGYVYEDQIGTTIPAENLYTSIDGDENGVVRTYGMEETKGNSIWYQGQTQSGGSSSETLMEGHELGEYCTTDSTVEFLTNGRGNYTNDEEGGTAIDRATDPAYTWTTYLEAPEDGEYTINFNSTGGTGSMTIYSVTTDENGETKETSIGSGSTPTENQGTQYYSCISATKSGCDVSGATVTLEKGTRYKIVIKDRLADISTERDMQLQLAWITPSQKEANVNDAVEAAKNNDTVVVFAYAKVSDPADTREETTLKMSDSEQNKILKIAKAAHEAGNKVVVVLNNDSQVVMEDWIDEVDSILEMYYPGQRGGVATAKLLTGEVNPSGRLAYTIPKKDDETIITVSDEAWNRFKVEEESEDSDSSSDGMGMFKSTPNTTYYDEGILTGYKWYDENDIEPQYDFGYGLSYTTFEYSDINVESSLQDGESVGYDVTFTVTNTGDVAGKDVAQVYLGKADVPDGIQSAEEQLAGYKKTDLLQPGESKTYTIHVNERALSYWNSNQTDLNENEDGTKDKWTIAEGERTITLARSEDEADYLQTVTVDVERTDVKKAQDSAAAAEKKAAAAEEAKEKAEAAQAAAEEAQAAAEEKAAVAEEKAAAAEEAQEKAEAAQAAAEEKAAAAEEAQEKAEAAQAAAEEKAEEIQKAAEEKAAAAEAAQEKAEKAQAAAEKAQAAAEKAQKAAEKAYNKALKLQVQSSKTTVTETGKKKSVKVTWKKISNVSGYEVKYSVNKNFKNAKTVKTTKLTTTIKNIKKGKKVYVKVRGYKTINGKKVYTKYSAVKSAKAK